jgi:hypothetical protein
MLQQRQVVEVIADYHQFYLWDRGMNPNAPEDYTDYDVQRRIKTGAHVVVIQPERAWMYMWRSKSTTRSLSTTPDSGTTSPRRACTCRPDTLRWKSALAARSRNSASIQAGIESDRSTVASIRSTHRASKETTITV